MGFKTVTVYNEEKDGSFFLLKNDGDTADVIFLYQNVNDVLVADTHYIKSGEYSGYAHCCGAGCPACAKGIRIQTKLFIPLYNIATGEIQFFDRSMKFEPQLQKDVLASYPNPSEYVFRITRRGEAGSIDTRYEIVAVAKNTVKSYAEILAEKAITLPAGYEAVCRELTADEMGRMLNTNSSVSSSYTPTPRSTATVSAADVLGNNATVDPALVPEASTPDVPYATVADEYVASSELAVAEPSIGVSADAEAVLDEPEF